MDKKERKRETPRYFIIEELNRCPLENTRRRDLLLKMLLRADELVVAKKRVRKKRVDKPKPTNGRGQNPGLAFLNEETKEN